MLLWKQNVRMEKPMGMQKRIYRTSQKTTKKRGEGGKMKGWLDGYNKKECKTECEKALNILHKLEDNTNYEIKELGKAITLLMGINFNKKRGNK